MPINKFSVGCCCNPCTLPSTFCFEVSNSHNAWLDGVGRASYYSAKPSFIPTVTPPAGASFDGLPWQTYAGCSTDPIVWGAGWYSCLTIDHTCTYDATVTWGLGLGPTAQYRFRATDVYYRVHYLHEGLGYFIVADFIKRTYVLDVQNINTGVWIYNYSSGTIWLAGGAITFSFLTPCGTYSCEGTEVYLSGWQANTVSCNAVHCCPLISSGPVFGAVIPYYLPPDCNPWFASTCSDAEAEGRGIVELVDCDDVGPAVCGGVVIGGTSANVYVAKPQNLFTEETIGGYLPTGGTGAAGEAEVSAYRPGSSSVTGTG